jgi:hypothetical protein
MFDMKLKNGQVVQIPEEQFHEFLKQYGDQVESHKVELRRPRVKSSETATKK